MIDMSNWKEFRVGDYFHGIRGTSRKMQALDEGDTPVIAAARYNQGIAGFYDVPSEYENAITISCNGVGCGSTYYHGYPFAITGDAIVLENIGNVPDEALPFIASVYDAYFSRKYSYADKCSADKAEAEMVILPATPDGKPDWDYMESYMKAVMEESEEYIRIVGGQSFEKHPVDVSGWGEFRVGDLLSDETLCVYGRNKKWIENENPTEKSLPVISGITVNNGIYYYTDDIPAENEVFEDCLTITTRGEYSGTLFYHEGKFVLANNILTLPFANTNKYTALFLKIAIEKLGYGGYDNYPKKDTLINDIVKLPVTPSGEPDWQYMEEYMKNVMEEQEIVVSNLAK